MPHPPLVLRVVSGALGGALFPIVRRAAVGRSVECDVSLPDASLSRRHFELTVDEGVCRLIDLESRNGVRVNGEGVLRAVVRPGDEIQAGDVVLRLETGRAAPRALYASTEPTLSATAPPPPDGTLLATLVADVHVAPPARLYALVDGAQSFELAYSARLMGHPLYTLFSGELAAVTVNVGPCLVALGEASAFLRRWTDAIGRHAGVLFESAAELDELWMHLREVFVASDEEGQEYFFRFYDPRVFRAFLPTCTPAELEEFFGPVTRWIVEADGDPAFASYALDGGRLITRAVGTPVRSA